MSKAITVIYPMFNRVEYTRLSFPKMIHECLESKSLIESIFVYDDNSEDGSSEFVQEIIEKYKTQLNIKYIRKKIGNSTFQINNTYKETESKYLVKIDNDIVIPTGYFKTLHWLVEKHSDIGFLMMPECGDYPFIKPKTELSVNDRSHIGGVGIFRRSIFVKKGDIVTDKKFFGFTTYQNQAKKELGVRTCELVGSGNMNLDASPVYSMVKFYELSKWGRNMWKGVNSIVDIKSKK
jgi:glycosyltransferase involved in cell wall biosynthesis